MFSAFQAARDFIYSHYLAPLFFGSTPLLHVRGYNRGTPVSSWAWWDDIKLAESQVQCLLVKRRSFYNESLNSLNTADQLSVLRII
jgi:hypothetical protein